MPLDRMARIYGLKTKTLYTCEHISLDDWATTTTSSNKIRDNLKIEDFNFCLSNKLATPKK